MLKFLVLVLLLAVIIYAVARVIQRRGVQPIQGPVRKHRPQRPRTIAPDDDPDFLRDLDRKRKHPEDPDSTG